RVPEQRRAGTRAENEAFLARRGPLVVKPARGEQGRGVSVNIADPEELETAVRRAAALSEDVVLEEFVEGQDLRVVLIDYEVVAAAVRKPAAVIGNGRHSVRELIEKQSRRREAATGGESSIPLDDETKRAVARRGYSLDDVLPEGVELEVRATANLHTGGTLHDVTADLSPALASVSREVARALEIPVVGGSVGRPGLHRRRAGRRPIGEDRGDRAPRPRESGAAADRGALRRPALSGNLRGPAAGGAGSRVMPSARAAKDAPSDNAHS